MRALVAAASPAGGLSGLGARRGGLTVDLAGLEAVGWDSQTGVLTVDPSHRLLGYELCTAAGCRSEARVRDGLCEGCAKRRRAGPASDIEAFRAIEIDGAQWPGEQLCLVCRVVGGCRPAGAHGLCTNCNATRRRRQQSVEGFVGGDERFAPASPRPAFGDCSVVACERLAAHKNGLCNGHDQAWRRARCPGLVAFTGTASAQQSGDRARVVLRGLPDRVVVEVLYGVQTALIEGRRFKTMELRSAVNHLRRVGAGSLATAAPAGAPITALRFLAFAADRIGLAETDPETEARKDIWDLRVWGGRGHLSFVGGLGSPGHPGQVARPITQPWLREAAKRWAADALVSKRPTTVQEVVRAVGWWSEHLARNSGPAPRPDDLGRGDIEAFLARLGRLETAGTLSRLTRARVVDVLAGFFRDCRAVGLTHPGQSLAGLRDDIVFRRSDHLSPPRRDDGPGRAIPADVMAQLLSEQSLAVLEGQSGTSCRAAVELQAGVGRRTAELCALAFDCLDYDTHNGADNVVHRTPVLVHDMPKVGKIGCRLPVHDREANIIRAQQGRVRALFPDTPTAALVLFPATRNNPDGTTAISTSRLQRAVDRWATAIPDLDCVDPDDPQRSFPFPRDAVFPYAWRHSFAQRHADSGTPVDTLKDLLGHDTVRSTLGYYRVTAKRKRDAQDRLGPLQLDAAGRLVRPGTIALGEADALREQIGQVAVPFGICTEPTNVAAAGRSCPFRHRCTGCEYFRTDPSYQSELRSYLAQLLADRERLATALPALAEWARRDAAPSDDEIDAVRRLVRANHDAVASLDDDDRSAVEAAIATIRTGRAHLDVTFPVELRGLTRQVGPTLFPTIERAARRPGDHD